MNVCLETLAAELPEVLLVLDADRRIEFLHETAALLVGRPAGDVLGQRIDQVFPAELNAIFLPALLSLYRTSAPQRVETHPALPGGAAANHEGVYLPMRAGNRVERVVIVVHDVTRLHRIQTESRGKSRPRERSLDDASLAIAVVEPPEWRYTMANPAFQAIPGPGIPLPGRTLAEAFPEQAPRIIACLEEVLHTGRPVASPETRIATPGAGEPTYWDVHCLPLGGARGRVDSVLVLAQDVSGRVMGRRRLESLAAQAEESLERLEAILGSLGEGLMIVRPDGSIDYGNPVLLDLFGAGSLEQARAEIPSAAGVWRLSSLEGDPLPAERQPIARALRGEHFVEQELRVRRADGTAEFIGSYNGTPIYDRDGSLKGGVVTVRKITERKRGEEALLATAERLRLGRSFAFEWTVASDEVRRSPEAEEILGLSGERILHGSSRDHSQMVHPEDRERFEDTVRALAPDSSVYLVNYRFVRPDGREIALQETAQGFFNAQGRLVRVVGVAADISERSAAELAVQSSEQQLRKALARGPLGTKRLEEDLRRINDELERLVVKRTKELAGSVEQMRREMGRRVQAEEALRERSAMLEAFFRHSISPIAFLDRDFRFLRVNEAYARAAGRRPEELVGLDHFQIYPDEENQRIYRRVLRTGEPHRAFGRPLTSPERPGPVSSWDWALTPLRDDHGQVEFLVLSMENVTQRQGALEQLRTRTRQLQELAVELTWAEDKERHRLAELLHDDLQQLLVGAKMKLRAASARLDEKETAGQTIAEVSQLLDDSVRKTRSLSHELSSPVLDHGGLIEGLGWLARQMERKFQLRVQIDASPSSEPRSETLRLFLYRAIEEMLLNVVKHAGVRVAGVRLRRSGSRIAAFVVDAGAGFQLSGIRLQGGTGGGFGLFSIRERVQFLGGRMRISSRPGLGSCVAIALPDDAAQVQQVTENPPVTTVPSHLPLEHRAGRSAKVHLRVVVADDHKVLRDGLAALLAEEADIEVVGEASNGREAVTLAARLGPDVIIMDVAMPGMDGIAATREISARFPGIRVIGLSMFDEVDMAQTMLDAGAEVFLPKAGPAEALLAAIRGDQS